MKIAFLGNMNNNHFAMVRFLRDRGVDADLLLLNNEQGHFLPACDTYSLDYRSYCRQLGWGSAVSFAPTSAEQIRRDLAGYDVLVGGGPVPAFLHKAGMRLDIFIPYGDDIWSLTRYPPILPLPNRIPVAFLPVYHQRRGIPQSKVIHFTLAHDLFERQLQRYRGHSVRWTEGLPIVHTGTYHPDTLAEMAGHTHWAHEFARVRAACDLMIISHVRHCWKLPASDPNAKGTDRLLMGLRLFHQRRPDVRVRLVTIEYGKDVAASKARIAELGIEALVVWLPQMYRKDLMCGLHAADIVCAEFEHSWVCSGVLYEALVVARPLLAYREERRYQEEYPDLYPIMNAREPESIAARLEEYVDHPEVFQEMGRQGRPWYQEHIVDKALAKYLDYFQVAKRCS